MSEWRSLVPCKPQEDTCIIFGNNVSFDTSNFNILQLSVWDLREESHVEMTKQLTNISLENIEQDVPSNMESVFCEGVTNCSVSEMGKIFQGCVNFTLFLDQVKWF